MVAVGLVLFLPLLTFDLLLDLFPPLLTELLVRLKVYLRLSLLLLPLLSVVTHPSVLSFLILFCSCSFLSFFLMILVINSSFLCLNFSTCAILLSYLSPTLICSAKKYNSWFIFLNCLCKLRDLKLYPLIILSLIFLNIFNLS